MIRDFPSRYGSKFSLKSTVCFEVDQSSSGTRSTPAGTLSGGESFLASLALALALGDSAAAFSDGGESTTKLEALFLDERVSTPDQNETLPMVVETLSNLQVDDRMIRVISHIEKLAERLPARIEITKNGEKWRRGVNPHHIHHIRIFENHSFPSRTR